MTTVTKLKPCPFCGSTEVAAVVESQGHGGVAEHMVECFKCGASMKGSNYSPSSPIRKWNRRTTAKIDADLDAIAEADHRSSEAALSEDVAKK